MKQYYEPGEKAQSVLKDMQSDNNREIEGMIYELFSAIESLAENESERSTGLVAAGSLAFIGKKLSDLKKIQEDGKEV